jgi:hypothetical protein
MSALPAQVTEEFGEPRIGAAPVRRPDSRAQLMAERRAAVKAERQTRQRWAIGSCVGLGACFAVTAGILDVLH